MRKYAIARFRNPNLIRLDPLNICLSSTITMEDLSKGATKDPVMSGVCPFGILNIAAAVETYTLLQDGKEAIHKELRDWLASNYLEGNLHLLQLDEPLGRVIRSVEDLGMLAGAYGRARGLQRPKSGHMQNELYFYGQQPGRTAAVAAGKFMQQYFKPAAAPADVTVLSASVVSGIVRRPPPAFLKGPIRKVPLGSVTEVSEEDSMED